MRRSPLHGPPAQTAAAFLIAVAIWATGCASAPAEPSPAGPPPASLSPERLVASGVAVEFTAAPAEGGGEVRAGEETLVRFRVTDAATGEPMSGLTPAAWLDARSGETTPSICHAKIQAFLGGSMRTQALADLNTYYVLTLNSEGNISVIDPLSGFGGSRLLTLVFLKSPGADWALTADQKKLFVSMPQVNQVALVDTTTWKIIAEVDVGYAPGAVRLQPDHARAWITTSALDPGGDSGVTVLDAATNQVLRQFVTGPGAHEIAFSDDSRFAFVTSSGGTTISIFDAAILEQVGTVELGAAPVSVAYSRLAGAAFVATEDGAVTSIDGASHTVRSRTPTGSPLTAVRVSPDGRWALAAGTADGAVHALDTATGRLVQSIAIDHKPFEISFTRAFAYVRRHQTENITMIRLDSLGTDEGADLTEIPGGQLAPEYASRPSIASSIGGAREGDGVLIANAADKAIYFYSEGMAAPMGNFQNYKREPLAVLVVDRSVRETAPSVYSTSVAVADAGTYDVALFLDAPRVAHCFSLDVAPNPSKREHLQARVDVEPLLSDEKLAVGKSNTLRFRLTDAESGEKRSDVRDLQILTFLAPGIWQKRSIASGGEEGIYETTFTPPKRGIYYVFLSSPSLRATHRDLPHLILEAEQEATR